MVKCEMQEPVGQSEEEFAAGLSEEELAAAEQSERELAQLEEEETKRILLAKTLELGQTEDDLELELRGAPEEMLREAEDEAEDTEEDIPPTQEDIPPTQPEPVTPPKALPAEVQEELLTAAASVRPETMDSEDVRKLQLSMRAQEREKKEAEKAAKDAEKNKKAAKEPKPKGRPRKREVEGAAAAEGPPALPTKRLKRKTTLEPQAEDHGEEQKSTQKSETKEAPAKTKRTAAKEDPKKKKKGQETEEEQEKSEKKKAPAKTKRTTAKEDPAKKKKGQETEGEQEKSEKKSAPAKTKRTTAKEDPKKKKGQETEEEQEKSEKKKASPKKKAEKAEDKKKKTKATAEKGPKEVAATVAERSEDPVVPAAKRLRRAAGGGDLAAADPQLKDEMIGVIKNFDNKEYDRKGETMHHGKYGNDVQVVVYWTRSSVGVKLCLNGGWAQRYYYSFKDATIALNIFLAAKMCAKLQEKGVEWHRTADCTEYDKMLRATATAAVECAHD